MVAQPVTEHGDGLTVKWVGLFAALAALLAILLVLLVMDGVSDQSSLNCQCPIYSGVNP